MNADVYDSPLLKMIVLQKNTTLLFTRHRTDFDGYLISLMCTITVKFDYR